MAVGLQHYLAVGLALFCFGLFCVLTRRNAIGVLMGVELILNAANVNFIAFSRYGVGGYDGQVFSIFVIMLAAAEAAIALAIVLGIYRRSRSIDVNDRRRTQCHRQRLGEHEVERCNVPRTRARSAVHHPRETCEDSRPSYRAESDLNAAARDLLGVPDQVDHIAVSLTGVATPDERPFADRDEQIRRTIPALLGCILVGT